MSISDLNFLKPLFAESSGRLLSSYPINRPATCQTRQSRLKTMLFFTFSAANSLQTG